MKNLKRSTKIQMFRAAACILVAAVLIINTVFLYASQGDGDEPADPSPSQTEISTPEPTEEPENTENPVDKPTEPPKADEPEVIPSTGTDSGTVNPPAPIEPEATGTPGADATENPAPEVTEVPTDENGNTPEETPSVSPSVSPSITPVPSETPMVETTDNLSAEEGLPTGISKAVMTLNGSSLPKGHKLYVGNSNADFSSYTKSLEDASWKVIGEKTFEIHINDENDNEKAIPDGASATVTINFGTPAFAGQADEHTEYIVLHESSEGIVPVDCNYDANASGLKGITFTTDSFSSFDIIALAEDDIPATLNDDGTFDITNPINLTDITVDNSINVKVTSNNQDVTGNDYNIGTSFKLDMSYVFDEAKLQLIKKALEGSDQEYVTFVYQMPEEVSATTNQRLEGNLTTSDGTAGTYEIKEDGSVLFKVDSAFLKEKSAISGTFEYWFRLKEDATDKGDDVELKFPGTLDPVVIHVKKSDVNGWKDSGYDKETGKIKFKITLKNGDRASKSVAIVDTPQSNLKIDYDSIKITVNNEEIESAITSNQENFQIDLGDLEKNAEVIITYEAEIKDLTLDEDKNGLIDGIDNKFSWSVNNTFGGENGTSTWVKTESVGSKQGSVDGQRIKWTVKLNDGDIKSDVSNKVYTDKMTSKNQMYEEDTLKVIDENWKEVTSECKVNFKEDSFTVKLPSDAGNKGYRIEYYTKPAKDLAIGDKVEVKNEGDFDENKIPGDEKVIERESELGLTKTNSGIDLKTLQVKWTSVITPDDDGLMDPTFYDYIGNWWRYDIDNVDGCDHTWSGSVFVGNPVIMYEGKELESDRYSVTYASKYGATGDNYMEISFKGTYSSPITITYVTQDNGENAKDGKGIDNTCQVNGKYIKDRVWYQKTPGDVETGIFKNGYPQYSEQDKCYYVDWTVLANSKYGYVQSNGVADLGDDEVTIVDVLPEGLEYVDIDKIFVEAADKSDGKNEIENNQSGSASNTGKIDVDVNGQTLTITVKEVRQKLIYITFRTKITKLGETLTNTVTYSQNGKELGKATGNVTAGTDILHKEGKEVTVNSETLLEYTIKVNEKAINYLPDSDSLILEDTIPANVELVNGSVAFTNSDGSPLTEGVSYLYDSTSRVLSVQVPDGQSVIVKYQVKPILDGLEKPATGTLYKVYVANTVVLSGHENVKSDSNKWYDVYGSVGTIIGSKDKITLNKVDAQDMTKSLDGAEYRLYGMLTETGKFMELTDKRAITSTVSGKSGYACFDGLAFDTVYYYQETKAPEGYVLDSTRHYFIIKNNESSYADAVAAFKRENYSGELSTLLGGNTIICTNVRKSTAEISAVKRIEGAETASYAGKFNFTLTEVNENGDPVDNVYTETVSNKADGSIQFKELVYEGAGVHYYKITEESGEVPGIDYYKGSFIAKVEVIKNPFTGGFTTKVTYMDGESKEPVGKAEFVNKYSAEAELKVQKTYDGEFPENGFSFILKPVNGAPMPEGDNANVVVVNANNTEVPFNTITYTKDDTYEYTISEVIPAGAEEIEGSINKAADGIVYDGTVYDVKVVVKDGTATVSYKKNTETEYSDVVPSFKNKKQSGSITVTKKVIGEGAPSNETFYFTLKDSEDNPIKRGDTEIHPIKAGESVTFTDLEYGTYTVTETDSEGKPVSTSASFPYKVTDVNQPVTINGNSEEHNVTITNTYYAPEGYWIPVAKKVFNQGNANANPKFTFIISGDGVNDTITVEGSGPVNFTGITYQGLGAVGDHTYTITEDPGNDSSITYDNAVYTVTVNVFVDPDNDNNLKTEVTSVTKTVGEEVTTVDNKEVVFTNQYHATGDLKISAKKHVNEEIPDEGEVFTFELYQLTEEDAEATGKPLTATNVGETITFSKADVYSETDIGKTFWYLMKEQEKNPEDGYVTDTNSYKVKVTVGVDPNDKTKLIATPEIIGGNDKGEAVFNNIPYSPDSVPVRAVKKLVNGSIDEYRGRFKFGLYRITGDGQKELIGTTVTNGANENSAAGAIEFPSLNYTRADIGQTYTYEIREIKGDEKLFGFDTQVVTLTVSVTYNNKKVVATPTWSTEGDITFTNTYKPTSVSKPLVVKKITEAPEGSNLSNMQFTFVVKDEAGELVTKGTSGANGQIEFDKELTFTKARTYTYTIEEVEPSEEEQRLTGITYDGKVITAEVKVTDNHDGTLSASEVTYKVNGETTTEPKFENSYNPSEARIQFTGTKTLNGRNWISTDVFTFELWEETGADGKLLATEEATDANHAFSFELSYNQTDTYNYTIKEKLPEGAVSSNVNGVTRYTKNGITYDPKEYHVTVEVFDDGSGQLKAKLTSGDGNLVSTEKEDLTIQVSGFDFTNTYSAHGEFQLAVFKTVDEQKPAENEKFTFKLIDDKTGSPVGGEIQNTKHDAEKDIVPFDAITYTEPGTYKYTVVEEQAKDGYTNDTAVYTAAVTVEDAKHNGEFKISCQYHKNGSPVDDPAGSGVAVVTVNNSSPSKGTATIEADKSLPGGNLAKNHFQFTLSSTGENRDEKLVSRIGGGANLSQQTNDQGTVSFGPLTYDKTDLNGQTEKTYDYTITEKNNGETWIDYDPVSTRTVHVRVYLDGTQIKTQVIYDMPDGDLYKSDQVAVFHNDYKVSGTFDIAGTKTLTGGEQDRNFTFDLYKVDGTSPEGTVPSELVNSLTIDKVSPNGSKDFKFENIPLDQTGDFTYIVKEHIPDGDGVTYDGEKQTAVYQGVTYSTKGHKVTVHVADDGNGNLVATPRYEDDVDGKVSFTNNYNPAGTFIDIYGRKVLTGRTKEGAEGGRPLQAEEFTFGLYENNDLVQEVKNAADGSFHFHLDYYTAATHNYVVKEIPANALDKDGKLNNIKYDSTAVGDGYPVVVEVTDNNQGGLVAKITSAIGKQDNPVTITNTYEASTQVQLSATKTVNGGVPAESERGMFTFILEGSEKRQEVTNGATEESAVGSVSFDPITYTQADIGEHVYTVREAKGAAKQETTDNQEAEIYKYSELVYTVTVNVYVNEKGELDKSITYTLGEGETAANVGSITFNNEKHLPSALALSAKKVLSTGTAGGVASMKEFQFKLTSIGDNRDNRIPETGITVSNNGSGEIAFTTIQYDLNDIGKTYEYTIEELIPEEATPNNNGDWVYQGVTYDSNRTRTITVEVTKDADGNVKPVMTCKDNGTKEVLADGKEIPVFTNTYTASKDFTPEATKTLIGRAMDAGEFQFVLEGDNVSQTKGNSAAPAGESGAITFEPIHYTLADAGKTYTYTVSEVNSNKAGIKYDDVVYTITVKVKDNGDGTLGIEDTYQASKQGVKFKDKTMAFTNTYQPIGGITLSGTKKLTGRAMEGEEFHFVVKEGDEQVATGTSTEATNGIATVINFTPISYTLDDVGDHIYTITEVTNDLPVGVKPSTENQSFTVVVKVTDNPEEGRLDAQRVEGMSDKVAFENTYTATGQLPLKALKTVNGDKPGDDVFTFTLEGGREGKTISQSKPNNSAGEVTFDPITYNQDDIGKTFTYTVKESQENKKNGYTYDQTEYTVEVTVSRNDNKPGGLEITSIIKKDNTPVPAIEFNNTYPVAGKLNITAQKGYNVQLVDGDFTFTLTGPKLPDAGQRKTNVGNTITFDTIPLDKSDVGKTYNYTITEQVDENKTGYVTYDPLLTRTVTVTVGERDGAVVPSSIVYSSGGKYEKDDGENQAIFHNTYRAHGELPLTATKILDGRSLTEKDKFKFVVVDTATKSEVATGVNNGETITFTKINYNQDQIGKIFTYEISELPFRVGEERENETSDIKYDGRKYTLKVQVTDPNHNGTLKPVILESNIPNGGMIFINEYTPTPKEIWISKVDAASKNELAGASMTIADADGKVLDTWVSGRTSHSFKADYGKTYTLTETIAPKGYLIAESITFRIDTDGNLWIRQADGNDVQQTNSVVTMVDQAESVATPTPTPDEPMPTPGTPTTTPGTTPAPSTTPGTTETPAPSATPETTPEATATPAVTPGTTPVPEETPSTEVTPAPENTPNPVVTPRNNPAPTPRGSVLGARKVKIGGTRAAVLGARRGADFAVLGKRRRPATGDSMALLIWIITLSAAMGGAVTSSVMLSLENGKKRRRRS